MNGPHLPFRSNLYMVSSLGYESSFSDVPCIDSGFQLFLVYPARYCWGRNKGFKAKILILIQFELCEKFGLWCVDIPLHYSQRFPLPKYLL